MTRKVVDIESNDLLANMLDFSRLPYRLKTDAKLWCIVVRDIDTKEVTVLASPTGDTINKEQVRKAFEGATEIIAHNGIKFDFLAMKLFGVMDYEVGYLAKPDKIFGQEVKITDTLIRSRLFNPDRYGGHSLKAWGERLGNYKDDFRQQSIDAGIIPKTAAKAEEFRQFSQIMVDYCIQDTAVTELVHLELEKEFVEYPRWKQPEKLENKLADLAIRRESYGFFFDRELALWCLDDLQKKMKVLADNVTPRLPPKKMNKGTIKAFTPPAVQIKQNGEPSVHMMNFAKKHNAELDVENKLFIYNGYAREMPFTDPIETHEVATIDDLDHVKLYLISLGWRPTEFKIRDLSKNSKKQAIPFEKQVAALDKWLEQTFDEGKYTEGRLSELGISGGRDVVRSKLLKKLQSGKPCKVPTAPSVRTGVEKELCSNLTSLGEKVAFANDFALYLTYRHRKSSIAGGDIEDMDFDEETPNTGFLAMYREVDGRVPTPAIEIGASTNRYRHIGVCNIARASSEYGEYMRSMFGCGVGRVQFGQDASSLEACIQGHYILPFNGEELAVQLLAKKPHDIHTLNAIKLFGTADMRDPAKSISYALMYGASYQKLKSMLGLSDGEAKALFDAYWEAVKPLSDLKDAVAASWKARGSKYVVGVDGRKIMTRSQHSLLNALFQSGGVICMKYITVFLFEDLEGQGLNCDPFEHEHLHVVPMIEYHDEQQLSVDPKLITYKIFASKDEAKAFIETWEGEQLGSLVEGKNGTFVLAMPNVVSIALCNSYKRVVETVALKVPLGNEWVVHKNWYGCH